MSIMSSQVSAASILIQDDDQQNSNRHSANFHPTLWGDHFLAYANDSMKIDPGTREEYEELKQDVRRLITANTDEQVKKLHLIDIVQRLGVAYLFEKEIEDELEKIHDHLYIDSDNDHDLYTVSLAFRLMRQQGIKISCDVFEKFKDEESKFKATLISDIQGLLSLYEAAHLAIHEEDILDEAIAFATTHLKSAISHVCPNLAKQINHALHRPLRKTLPRLDTLYFLSIYPRDDSYNKKLLKFAKLDFNMLQATHQEELSAITRWWKDLDFTNKLPYARDRLVELYFWILGVYFEPKYALARKMMTKVIYIASIIDDTYDAYGTFEELKLFTEVVKRWDIGTIDILPEYMKIIYKTLLDIYGEIEGELAKQGRSYCLRYVKEKMQELVAMDFVEAKWFNEGYVPTIEEYMEVALISVCNLMLATISFVGMGDIATKESFEWISSNPKIVRASSVICRLMDDIVSHKFEQSRGHVASAIECYMKQHGVFEEDAVNVFRKEVENAWKDMNQELLKPTAFPMPLMERVLNLARVMDYLHKDSDSYTNAHLVKDQIASLLRDPLPL
ncbi:Terpene synthase [Melia azedarach]|uniref:Terpene synthase n=2 Tax=Melia azedarach TaxID=155640 RepID=A0ACC1Y5D9_MELAZ|nr:Terpene synthase [Melia azedarach]KAJ4718956.1 Terpene synthase [Melia azedarach]